MERHWIPSDWDDVLVQEEILNSCPSSPPAPEARKSMGLIIPLLVAAMIGFVLHIMWQRCKQSQGYERIATEEGAEMTHNVRTQYS